MCTGFYYILSSEFNISIYWLDGVFAGRSICKAWCPTWWTVRQCTTPNQEPDPFPARPVRLPESSIRTTLEPLCKNNCVAHIFWYRYHGKDTIWSDRSDFYLQAVSGSKKYPIILFRAKWIYFKIWKYLVCWPFGPKHNDKSMRSTSCIFQCW